MKKLESNFRNMVLALTGVSMVAVALLAWVNQLTQEPIRKAKTEKLEAAIAEVLTDYDNDPTMDPDTIEMGGLEYVIFKATLQGKPAGAAVESTDPRGFSGAIKLLVGFDEEGNVLNYSVLSMSETPGLGTKADTWFKKGERGDITGMNPGREPLKLTSEGGQVDAITASTVTTRSFIRAVNNAYLAYKDRESGADGTSGATAVSGATGATAVSGASSHSGKEDKK